MHSAHREGTKKGDVFKKKKVAVSVLLLSARNMFPTSLQAVNAGWL